MCTSIRKLPKLFGGHSRLFRRRKSPSTEVDTNSETTTFSEGPSGTVLIHSSVELKRGWKRQKRHLFLFSDLLLVTNTKYRKNLKIKNEIPLNTMWMADNIDEKGRVNTAAKKSFVLGWPTVNYMATFSSSEQKEKWSSFLQRYISLAKEQDNPKSIPLKIFTEDVKTCPITLTVTNSDTTNDIISMSLPVLGLCGSKNDYQLWVSSGKKEAPYPLIGHEHPYGIEISHLPATRFLPRGPKASTSSTLKNPLSLEQSSLDMEVQFILKSRYPVKNQKNKDAGQKRSKRKWFVIKWPFQRGSSPCQENLCPAPPAPLPGRLFGLPLTVVCGNGYLPNSLQDMLFFINEKGPLTEGIFRISPNEKSCRTLKEKLNSGEKVDMDKESVLVIASVLKDFFQNIQGSVFSSNLYHEWLAVIDLENEKEKITEIQRLLDQLPRANVVLLQYLFGVLRNIDQFSVINQMTAYDLSVCIAPSILWNATSCGRKLKNEVTKKVSLVQFLIEHCLKIFGEYVISSLWGECSTSYNNSEGASGMTVAESFASESEDVSTEEALEFESVEEVTIEELEYESVEGVTMEELESELVEGVTVEEAHESESEKVTVEEPVKAESVKVAEFYITARDYADDAYDADDANYATTSFDMSQLPIDLLLSEEELLDQLPRANVVLLQYLCGVLRNIEQFSVINQMTAYDLSVSLVQFLIEYCLKIFGEYVISSLWGECSTSYNNSEGASGMTVAESFESESEDVSTEEALEFESVEEVTMEELEYESVEGMTMEELESELVEGVTVEEAHESESEKVTVEEPVKAESVKVTEFYITARDYADDAYDANYATTSFDMSQLPIDLLLSEEE